MIRRLLVLAALITVSFASFTSSASAGCSSGYRPSYHRSYVRHVHHVRHVSHPVTVVRPSIQVVQPAIVAPPVANYPAVPAGSTLTIPANFLGNVPGSVFMVFNDIKLPVQIGSWTESGVTITLPPMAIKDAVLIRLDIVLPNGSVGHTQKINVTAPAPVVLHPVAPTSPLPTNAALGNQFGLNGN